MRRSLSPPSASTVRLVVLGTVAVTLFHFTDNAINVDTYPKAGWQPDWFEVVVVVAWVLYTGVGFRVRHLVISKVNGRFTNWSGSLVLGGSDLADSKVEITIELLRFPSKDTAIEEGYAKSYKGDSAHPTTSRYSVLHVREGGRWLMALLREWPDEGVSLRDLDWLIGTWEAKTDETQVRTTYEWDAKKNSIRCHITIKGRGRTVSGTQVLLKDPRTGQLRSWLFDDDGGFGDGAWTRDGKRWVITATGVQADGGELTATNILTPVNRDTFTWQSTERTLDGEELSNVPPVKVRRVK